MSEISRRDALVAGCAALGALLTPEGRQDREAVPTASRPDPSRCASRPRSATSMTERVRVSTRFTTKTPRHQGTNNLPENFGALVVCNLLASSVGAIWLRQGRQRSAAVSRRICCSEGRQPLPVGVEIQS